VGLAVESIQAVCLTHEHDDHTSGVAVMQRKFPWSFYANAGTAEAVEKTGKATGVPWKIFTTGSTFSIGDLVIEPFSVPHDSYDPVGFVVGSGGCKVGIVTDMGLATNVIRERLRPCRVLVLESNHDEKLLKDSKRPWSLKQRIAGRQGHLSNLQAAGLVREIAGPGLKAVFLAHLSRDCNRPELAEAAVRQSLLEAGYANVSVSAMYPDRPGPVVEVGA
jgi:phosphoribosyl 1,2-cyclic phosphodiesterase